MITEQKKRIEEIKLIGLALPSKTTNKNDQSAIDCGNLWKKFEKGNYISEIPHKLNNDIFAVYHGYEGDHTQPFSYFIGCQVNNNAELPEGMDAFTIPSATYQKIIASGKMPDCMTKTWKEIWETDLARTFETDFEVYDERSQNWENAEVDIFLSVQK